MTWQTKTLAMFIAATVETEGENPLIAEAQKIGEKHTKEGEEAKTTKEPNVGSYERFFATFGSPARWAGGTA